MIRVLLPALLLVACVLAPAARSEEVRIGYSLSIDLPWTTLNESSIKSGPEVKRAQSYVVSLWSEEYGRILAFLAIVPRPNTYFSTGGEQSLEKQIEEWNFFKDKKITDRKSLGCVYGTCLSFKADDAACAVFRRQIGTAGKARVESYSETAGPRLYGFYCSYATPTLETREIDWVLQSIKN